MTAQLYEKSIFMRYKLCFNLGHVAFFKIVDQILFLLPPLNNTIILADSSGISWSMLLNGDIWPFGNSLNIKHR